MYISSLRGTHGQFTEMLAYVEGVYLPLALNIVTLPLLEIINVTRIDRKSLIIQNTLENYRGETFTIRMMPNDCVFLELLQNIRFFNC